MSAFDYLIVGSGITGATLAYLLKKKGRSVMVVEKRPHVGGNVATETRDGIVLHTYGPHIFHTSDERAWNFFCEHADVYPFINSPLAFYQGKYYNMPFNLNTFEQLFGTADVEEIKAIIAKEVAEAGIQTPRNLEEQAISMVGTTIYRVLVKGYTEKQWGRSARELPPDIIKRLPLRFERNNNYFNDTYQGIPKGGYSVFIENLLEDIPVWLQTDYLKKKEAYDTLADKVIYTGRLDEYFGFCFGALEWRSLRFETTLEPVDSFQPAPVVNFTDSEPAYTRITEHKKFDPDCPNASSTIVSREYPDAFAEGKIPYYTVNDARNSELAFRYFMRAKKEPNLILAGRLATYRYLDMDDALIAAFNLAESL